ncbi:hypothetical protein MPLB_1820031 [Mesorhizobium sp. ORS 3324]|nr:hypothetical protein MPLB_1820031 [Mesorhizobium sp. ORS 3324]
MASASEPPRWGELAERVAERLGLDRARSPTLKTTIERGVRYIKVDDDARQLVFDTRALFIGLVAAGQEDRDSIRYGNTASWFVDWLQKRVGTAPVFEIVGAQLGSQDSIFAALADGYRIQLSTSVRSLLEPASHIARTTIQISEYEARHLFGAMILRGVVADQVRQLFSIDLTDGDIAALAQTFIDRVMTSPQPNETRASWLKALGTLFDPQLESSADFRRIEQFLQGHGINAVTSSVFMTLNVAAGLNQSDDGVAEISSSRLFAAALRATDLQTVFPEMAAVNALLALSTRVPFHGIGDVVASFSDQPEVTPSGARRFEATENVNAILRRARSLAATFDRPDMVGMEALIAALLLQPGTKLQQRLGENSIDPADLQAAVLEQLQTLDRPHIRQWYSAFGARLPASIEVIFANLRNDSTDGDTLDDKLNVEDEARAFARVAAARQVLSPLAFGIFGDWGSGKSFFMRLIHRHVAALAKQASTDAGGRQSFHQQIVQIRFNAWHYAETNLWASLVDNIFVELDGWLRAKNPERGGANASLLDKLATARELTLDSAQRLLSQRRQQKLASERVASAERELAMQRGRLASTPRLFWKVVGKSFAAAIAKNDDLKKATKTLGLDQLQADGEALKSALDALGEEGKRTKIVAKATRAQLLGGPFLVASLTVILVVPPLVGLIGKWVLAHTGTDDLFGMVHLVVLQLSTLAIAIAGIVRIAAGGVKTATTVIDKHREELLDAIEKELKTPTTEVKKAEEQLAKLTAELAESKAILSSASGQLAKIANEYEGDIGGGRLLRFVRERASEGLYARHLGLIATIRQDFTELSALMAVADHTMQREVARQVSEYRLRVSELIASSKEGDLLTLDEQETLMRSSDLPTTSKSDRFERIILYIDDLDRCPPEKVVQVLQAVHLLLSFPLFVVVVAVDSRWVSKSLASHYAKLLAESAAEGATAGDYLEKIFQVPYWVRGMSQAGSHALLASLVTPPLREASVSAAAVPEQDDGPSAGAEKGHAEPVASPAPAEAAAKAEEARPVAVGAADSSVDMPVSTVADATALTLTSDEVAYIEMIAPFTGRTPRRALRFLNTYRVIKASLDSIEVARLEAGGYRSLMTQLAIVTGSPGLHLDWVTALDQSEGNADLVDMPARLKKAKVSEQSASLLLGALAALVESTPNRADLVTDLKRYGEIARRYSFESA